ncbi:MAG: class I SAM-dependent methyltransferase [Candidatus Omnitrophica bacterium]|nr:class I SAM-dependent methyltransferase [Candidatus Omnitrophota bacterium]
MTIPDWLKLPEANEITDLNDASTTLLHAKIIQSKPFLKNLYRDFYKQFCGSLNGNTDSKLLVELGSGGGFIKDVIPNVVTSDVVRLPHIDRHFSALNMPFENNTVDAFFMINVLHHLKDSRAFFRELARSLKIGGKVVMVESANTPWNRFIHINFHHEQFDIHGSWGFKENGRLSGGNSAIPWIVFYRDKQKFLKEFPMLKIKKIKLHTPFRFLISGGLTAIQLLPSWSYKTIRALEILLSPLNRYISMFMTVEIEKVA